MGSQSQGHVRFCVSFLLACTVLLRETLANVFLNSPRGSNNKMTEQSNGAINPNRLFKSDNHPSGGYQIGDNCVPNCKGANENYDATKPGSQEGQMHYYAGSELYIEWVTQHGCGTPAKNTECQIILQYMCSSFSGNYRPGATPVRDGKDPDSTSRRRTAGGNNPIAAGASLVASDELDRGRHESFESFDLCRKRRRNQGLFSGGQNLNVNVGAATSRQNANGTRYGMECPEERDYYPYWHPTEWRDIAVFSSEANKRCDYYRKESQNVKRKGFCNSPSLAPNFPMATLPENQQIPNNPATCGQNQGEEWVNVDAWGIEPPECKALVDVEDNLLGTNEAGKFQSYTWKIPDTLPDNDTCVLRVRYNITSGDYRSIIANGAGNAGSFDYFLGLDSRFNIPGRQPLQQDPKANFIGLEWNVAGPLQMQVNTAQFGRTFQDRSHSFQIRKRPLSLSSDVRIVNYNVRGRRGNLVEVFPASTYGFVPPDLNINQGDFLHFQWTGSDANANNNSGHGRIGTDRSNLVQIANRATNVPVPLRMHTLFFDAAKMKQTAQMASTPASTGIVQSCTGQLFSSCDRSATEGAALIAKFSFLDQQRRAEAAGTTCPQTEGQAQTIIDNSDENCLQLNFAPAYFDGGLVEMTVVGEHHIASTRNNDYSNASQKATIIVLGRKISWSVVVALVAGIVLGTLLLYQIAIAIFAYRHPTSDMFSSKHRPMLLKVPVITWAVQAKEEERRSYRRALRDVWSARALSRPSPASMNTGGASPSLALPSSQQDPDQKQNGGFSIISACCRRQGTSFSRHVRIENLFLFIFYGTNLLTIFIGFMRNFDGGFNKWFCMAKVGGYILDFNLACILVPTLRSIHTVARPIRALDKLFNEEPIHFHIQCAGMVAFGAILHIRGHAVHIAYVVASAPYEDPITPKQRLSGMTVVELLFNPANRFAGFTGVLISYLMLGMYMTAVSFVRRHTFDFNKKMPRSFQELRSWFLLLGALFLFLPFWLPGRLWRRFMADKCQAFLPGERGKLGGFKIFWEIHKCWKPCFVLLMVHGPNCWIWFMWPLVLVLCDRLLMKERRKITSHLQSAELLKGKVLKLKFEVPTGFSYQAGTYVLVNCDSVYGDEWHPFTLTSAPEENFLSVHIRCVDDLDFCSALRRRLVETPAMEISKGAAEKSIKSSRIKVLYSPYTAEALFDPFAITNKKETALSRPWSVQIFDTNESATPSKTYEVSLVDKKHEDLEAAADRLQTARIMNQPQSQMQRQMSEVTLDDIIKPQRPKDVIQMSLDGPHGAPSELVWRHRVVVLVGAGIGVTPFAAILRSVTLRLPTKAEILAGPAGGGALTKRTWRKKEYQVDEEYVVDWKPCEHVHFYWLCKNQEEFEWFYDLLSSAVTQASKDRIEVNLFKSGETELSAVKQRREDFREFFGRPNWNRIFPNLAKAYPEESVGCFYCGPPALRNDLAAVCHKATLTNEHGSRFTLYAENF